MAIVIPDLFGSYQKGKEEAIKANWADLSNYEDIEAKRTANDINALDLLARQYKWNGELQKFDAGVRDQLRQDELASLLQQGKLDDAHSGNLLAQARRAVTYANKDNIVDGYNNLASSWYDGTRTNRNNADTNYVVSAITNNVYRDPTTQQNLSDIMTGNIGASANTAKLAPAIANQEGLARLTTAQLLTLQNKLQIEITQKTHQLQVVHSVLSAQNQVAQDKVTGDQIAGNQETVNFTNQNLRKNLVAGQTNTELANKLTQGQLQAAIGALGGQ